MSKIPKMRMDIYLDVDNYTAIINETRQMGYKNISFCMNEVILEWRRFKSIVLKEKAKRFAQDIKNAEVIKQ